MKLERFYLYIFTFAAALLTAKLIYTTVIEMMVNLALAVELLIILEISIQKCN